MAADLFSWARICKRLRSPGINSEESIPPAYVAWRPGTTNRVIVLPARQAGNRFLGSLKGLRIRARLSESGIGIGGGKGEGEGRNDSLSRSFLKRIFFVDIFFLSPSSFSILNYFFYKKNLQEVVLGYEYEMQWHFLSCENICLALLFLGSTLEMRI